jgi:RHS repeat-associated protein
MTRSGPWPNSNVQHTWDSLGRKIRTAAEGGSQTDYGYDTLNRLISITVESSTYTYGYVDANPLVQNLTRPNGSRSLYQYDDLDRLLSLSNQRGDGQIINQFDYAYNAADMRSSETVSNGLDFTFDKNQLVTDTYNALNQLVSSGPSDRLFAYDADGNMTQGYTPTEQPFIATYDAENRLTFLSFTNSTGIVYRQDYVYNGYGFLARLDQYTNGTLSGRMALLYDGRSPVQERDASNATTREYVWGLSFGGGIGGLLELSQGGESYSYLYDGKGNVVAVLANDQTTVGLYAYDPFGSPLAVRAALHQPIRFSTKFYDDNSGLSYFGYRFYSSSMSRWLSRDPLGERSGLNLYAYVKNSPVARTDPLGLSDGSGASPLGGSCSDDHQVQVPDFPWNHLDPPRLIPNTDYPSYPTIRNDYPWMRTYDPFEEEHEDPHGGEIDWFELWMREIELGGEEANRYEIY